MNGDMLNWPLNTSHVWSRKDPCIMSEKSEKTCIFIQGLNRVFFVFRISRRENIKSLNSDC